MKAFLPLAALISVILISGCTGTNIAQNLVTEYGQVHDYDLKESYNYFDGSTEVVDSTYIQPTQQTTVGLLSSIETIAGQFFGSSLREEEYDGKQTYVLVLASNVYGKDETTTQAFWIDKETYLPMKMERYISGSDSLFEKLKNSPEILNFVYGDTAAQNMIFITSGLGYRLFTVDYEFSDINTRLDESVECVSYNEDNGLCFSEISQDQQAVEELPTLVVPSYMPGFAMFNHDPPSITIPVEEPYLFAENITKTHYYYYETFSPSIGVSDECGDNPVYSKCRTGVDFSEKITVLQSRDKFLMLTYLPDEDTQVETVSVNGGDAIFTEYEKVAGSPSQFRKKLFTLRWKRGQDYLMIVYESNRPTDDTSPVVMNKEEMIKIAESVVSASMIVSISETV